MERTISAKEGYVLTKISKPTGAAVQINTLGTLHIVKAKDGRAILVLEHLPAVTLSQKTT